jgi:hypothetical protein
MGSAGEIVESEEKERRENSPGDPLLPWAGFDRWRRDLPSGYEGLGSRRNDELVASFRDGHDEARLARIVAERLAELGDALGQDFVGYERALPDLFVSPRGR